MSNNPEYRIQVETKDPLNGEKTGVIKYSDATSHLERIERGEIGNVSPVFRISEMERIIVFAEDYAKIARTMTGSEQENYIANEIRNYELAIQQNAERMTGREFLEHLQKGPGSTRYITQDIPGYICCLRVLRDIQGNGVVAGYKASDIAERAKVAIAHLEGNDSRPKAPKELKPQKSLHIERESIPKHENIYYHPDVAIFGDQHGDIELPQPGQMAVYVGDILDVKKPNEANFDPVRFKQNFEKWLDLVEKDEAIFTLGNHDAKVMMLFHYNDFAKAYGQSAADEMYVNWLNDGGTKVLEALGIPVKTTNLTTLDREEIRQALTNPLLQRFYLACKNKGKMYAIVNDVYIAHTLPMTDKEGELIPFEEGLSGLDAMDLIQARIRQGDFDTIKRLYYTEWKVRQGGTPTGQKIECGPLWVREGMEWPYHMPLIYNKTSDDAERRRILMKNMNQEAAKKGVRINKIIYGHVASGGNVYGDLINVDYAANAEKGKRNPDLKVGIKATGKNAQIYYYNGKDRRPQKDQYQMQYAI